MHGSCHGVVVRTGHRIQGQSVERRGRAGRRIDLVLYAPSALKVKPPKSRGRRRAGRTESIIVRATGVAAAGEDAGTI